MNKIEHFERVIKAIEARIAEHDGSSDPDELEYVSGLEDALGIVELELGSIVEANSLMR